MEQPERDENNNLVVVEKETTTEVTNVVATIPALSGAIQLLIDGLNESFEKLDGVIEEARNTKLVDFAELESKIENVGHESQIDNYEVAIEEKRTALIGDLQADMRALIDGIRPDMNNHFQIGFMAPRERLRSFRQLRQGSIEDYLDKKAAKFSSKKTPSGNSTYLGTFSWKDNYDSLQCIKYNEILFNRYIEPPNQFMFCGQPIRLANDLKHSNKHMKFHYQFELLDSKGNVMSIHPIVLFFDLYRPTSVIYTYGRRLLIVKNFANVYNKQLYNMLKKIPSNTEMPLFKSRDDLNLTYFAVIDPRNFKITKEFLSIGFAEDSSLYWQSVEFVNDDGIMISKRFPKFRIEDGQNQLSIEKKLVAFYDYNFKPIILDVALPDSEKTSHVVKLSGDHMHLVNFNMSAKNQVRLSVYDFKERFIIKTQTVNICERFRQEPLKFLLDSRDNLIILARPEYSQYMRPFIIVATNLTASQESFSAKPVMNYWNCKESYINEKDEIVIVTKEDFAGYFVSVTIRI